MEGGRGGAVLVSKRNLLALIWWCVSSWCWELFVKWRRFTRLSTLFLLGVNWLLPYKSELVNHEHAAVSTPVEVPRR